MRATPRRIVSTTLTALAIAVCAASSGRADAQADGGGGGGGASLPACMSVATEARYVPYGYNHIVLLKNGCSKAATCSVATDVNPQATSVEVASTASVEVLTFTASPAQTFHARVTCKLR
jgi:hypothetical protein